MVTCLKSKVKVAAALEFEPGKQMVAATAVNGDKIFILPLPRAGLAGRASQSVKEAMAETSHTGLLFSSTADRGRIFIGVIGVEGVAGGLPSSASEELARECATRRHPLESDQQPV